jgi:hypothetical protein
VQGRLIGKPVSVTLASRCAACTAPIRIEIDEELRWRTAREHEAALIFSPSVDWSRFAEPSILHAY